jgi:apolipoprotein N-acyltransferase
LKFDSNTKRGRLFLALLTGAGLGFSFPPFQAGTLAAFSFVPFFILFEKNKTYRGALKYSYITFFVLGIITSYWIGAYNIAKQAYLAITGTALLVLVPIIFCISSILWFFLIRQFGFKKSIFFFPFILVGTEYLLTLTNLLFPWQILGYSQTYDLQVIQFISFTGVHGISFWLLWINVLIYFLYSKLVSREWHVGSVRTLLIIILIAFIYLIPKFYGNIVLDDQRNKYNDENKRIRVGLVQPNIDPYEKWIGNVEKQLKVFQKLTDDAANDKSALVIWPETAVPAYILLPDNDAILKTIRQKVDSLKINLLTGITDWIYYEDIATAPKSSKWQEDGRRYDIYNSAMLLQPNNVWVQKYVKIKLVPFAERLPWAEELSFLNLDAIRWNFGAAGFGIGKDTTVFKFCSANSDTVKFSTMICYESLFPEFVAEFVRRGAQFLVVITNDSWWGNTSGVYQHEQYDILRAVENRRWVVRCANGGISCFIDPVGKTHNRLKFGVEAAVVKNITPQSELTFYSKHKDFIGKICVVLSVALLFTGGIKKYFVKNSHIQVKTS